MENHKQNEETKSNGIELLENVIKSNEKNIASNIENIEYCIKVQFDIEDLIGSFHHTQTDLREVKMTYTNALKYYEVEEEKRKEFLSNIPSKIETVLSQETIDFYENFEKKMKKKEKFIWSGFGTLILGILIMILSINFAKSWYKESIKSKSELRQDILNEIKNDGKAIYKFEDYQQLQHNTKVINKWMKAYPKDAEKFLRFNEGYTSR